MAEKAPKVTVTDEQIVTERKFPRRSFLAATGTLLAGAVAIASGVRASAQQADPDKKKPADPDTADKKKASDPDTADKKKKTSMKAKAKSTKKASDPDKKKTPPKSDPDGSRL